MPKHEKRHGKLKGHEKHGLNLGHGDHLEKSVADALDATDELAPGRARFEASGKLLEAQSLNMLDLVEKGQMTFNQARDLTKLFFGPNYGPWLNMNLGENK